MPQLDPITEIIPRRGKGTQPFDDRGRMLAAPWELVAGELRKGPAPFWLATVGRNGPPHVRPVFAAWTGSSFVVTSKHDAAKSRNLRADGRCTITADIGVLHVAVEGHAERVTEPDRLQLASLAMQDVFDWPNQIVGQELDAEYAAPTSGGPPFDVYEMRPHKAFGFPAQDDFAPTRWTFPEQQTN